MNTQTPLRKPPMTVGAHRPKALSSFPGHAPTPDFGWRLRGKAVRVLPDSSFILLPSRRRATAVLLARYGGDGNAVESCLQCGACTVNCQLSNSDGNLFPRRQMTLLQLGDLETLVADPSVWLCFNCKDCTSRCPAEAGPGRIMAAIRRAAVERYSVLQWWTGLTSRPQGFLCTVLASAALLLGVIALEGSFTPQRDAVRYASMLPHLAINLFFGTFAVLVMILAAISAVRAWKAFVPESLWETDLDRLGKSLSSAIGQITKHEQFSECQEFPLSRWAHLSLFYGFLTLLMLAGVAAALIFFGAPYPLNAWHPLKIMGNAAAIAIIAGSSYFCLQRQRSWRNRGAGWWFDWSLLLQLLLVSTTGVLAEIFRYTNSVPLAYPTYFLHLVFVLVLMAGLANSKFVHALYRTVAIIAEQYKRGLALQVPRTENRRMAA